MKMIYISHPYSGSPRENKADADGIRGYLKKEHPSICFVNPLGMFGDETTEYLVTLSDAMELLSHCDGMVYCEGWEDSVGCRAEIAFCKQQGIKHKYIKDFIQDGGF